MYFIEFTFISLFVLLHVASIVHHVFFKTINMVSYTLHYYVYYYHYYYHCYINC